MKQYSIFGIKPDVFTPLKERFDGNILKKSLPDDPYAFIDYVKKSLENYELEIINEKEYHLTRDNAEKHYEEHNLTPHFDTLIDFMISGNTYWIIFFGEDSIKKGREILVSIRTEYLTNPKARYNMTHAADSLESANNEIEVHFPELNGSIKNTTHL